MDAKDIDPRHRHLFREGQSLRLSVDAWAQQLVPAFKALGDALQAAHTEAALARAALLLGVASPPQSEPTSESPK